MNTITPYSDSTPKKAIIAIQRGTDQIRVFKFYETNTTTPINVASVYTDFVMEIRTRQNPNSTLLLRYELNDGIAITATNEITLTIPKLDTLSVEGGVYWYDLVCVKNGLSQALAQGRFEINNNITVL